MERIPTSWSQDKGERYRARDTVLAAVDMLTDEADEAGIDACPSSTATTTSACTSRRKASASA